MRKRFKYLFRKKQESSADIARKRLQIIISADKTDNHDTKMEQFKRDLLDVIARNFDVKITDIQEAVNVDVGERDGQSTLELNITLPNKELADAEPA